MTTRLRVFIWVFRTNHAMLPFMARVVNSIEQAMKRDIR